MTPDSQTAPHELPLHELLRQIRTVLQAQAEAINTDDFDGLARLADERDLLVTRLGAYAASDLDAATRTLVEQVAALDQLLVPLTRESQLRSGAEMRDLERGRIALQEYRRRGQTLIQNLAYLSQQR
jgi:hypothetical protein